VIIPSFYPPDGGRFFKEQAECLNKSGFQVNVIVNRLIGIKSHSFSEIFNTGRITEDVENSVPVTSTSTLKIPYFERRNTDRWIKKSLVLFEKWRIKNPRPDLIIAHSSIWAGIVARKIKDLYGIPYLLVEHRGRFLDSNPFTLSFMKDWYRDYYLPALRGADRIICVSEALRQGVMRIMEAAKDDISVIPNLADPEFFTLPEEERYVQPFIFLSIGMLEDVKGFDILIRAFADFTGEVEGEFFLRIGGAGKKKKMLKLLAVELGVVDCFSFLGLLTRIRVREEMQRANAYISASRFESFGVTLIEAAMTGLPLIATESGGPRSIIDDENGLLAENENPAALAKAMEELYSRYGKFRQDTIRQKAVERYSCHTVAGRYKEIIRDFIHGD